jgi:hypothetical protein
MEQKVERIARTFTTVVLSHTWMPPIWFNFPWESFQGKIRWGIGWLLSFPAWNSSILDWAVRCALNFWNGKWLQICRCSFLFAACLSRLGGRNARWWECIVGIHNAPLQPWSYHPLCSQHLNRLGRQGGKDTVVCGLVLVLICFFRLCLQVLFSPHLFITIKPFTITNPT